MIKEVFNIADVILELFIKTFMRKKIKSDILE